MRLIPWLFGLFLAVLLTTFSSLLEAGTGEQVVAGQLGDSDFTTIVGLQNTSGKDCNFLFFAHKGAATPPDFPLLINGSAKNSLTGTLPSWGAATIEVSTPPESDQLFVGAASVVFTDTICLDSVGITAKYAIDDSLTGTISELFSYPVNPALPLGYCAVASVTYDPPTEIPARAMVSNGGGTLPAGTMRFDRLYDTDGNLLNESLPTNWNGEHDPKNLPEVFPDQEPFTGTWGVCTLQPPDFQGSEGFDTVFIEVVNRGAVQFGTTSDQPHNPDCQPDLHIACLDNRRFKVTLTVQDDSQGSPRSSQVRSGNDTSVVFSGAGSGTFLYNLWNGCSTATPAFGSSLFATPETDLGLRLTVTDTRSGQERTYENTLGSTFQPVLDTSAFATCP